MTTPLNPWVPIGLLLVGVALGAAGGLLVVLARYKRTTRALGALLFLIGSGMAGAALLEVTRSPFVTGFLGALYCLAVLAALLAVDSSAGPEPRQPSPRRFSTNRTTRVLDRTRDRHPPV
ncbi:MAG: hypothetical protein U0610_09250 [bacterium]